MKTMIAIILDEDWEAKDYINEKVAGWDEIKSWFEGFDARSAAEVCQVDYEQVREL